MMIMNHINFYKHIIETKQTIKVICYVEEDYQYPNYQGITYVNMVQEIPEYTGHLKKDIKIKLQKTLEKMVLGFVRKCLSNITQVN